MSAEELAALLDGREIGLEITPEEAAVAKAAGLLVLYGASDDLLEAEGAFSDETDAYDGAEVLLDRKGFIPAERDDDWTDAEMEAYFTRRKAPGAISVRAAWCPPGYPGDPSWVVSTTAPHASFRIMEDGELFCVGCVIALDAGV